MAKALLFVFGLAAFLFLISLTGSASAMRQIKPNERYKIIPKPTDNSWDFLLLVQQWAPGVCATETEHQCNIPSIVNSWTMHGLWPNNNDGSYPSNCNSSEPFDPNAISSLMSEMNQYWPDLYSSDPTSFWSHEWDKHGTCAQSDQLLGTELRFFNQALSLRSEYDIYNALNSAGITPSNSNTYSGSQLTSAVTSALGFAPLLQCEYSNNLGGKAIVQLALCIDKNLQIFSCPSAVQNKGIGKPCYSSDQIYVPPFN